MYIGVAMDYIKIVVNKRELMISVNNKKIICGNKIKEIDEEKIDELIRILRSWKKEINNTNVVDGDEYVVRIISGDLVDEYNDKLKYPDNYHEFKKWLDDVYE